jgi:hypothetical protein
MALLIAVGGQTLSVSHDRLRVALGLSQDGGLAGRVDVWGDLLQQHGGPLPIERLDGDECGAPAQRCQQVFGMVGGRRRRQGNRRDGRGVEQPVQAGHHLHAGVLAVVKEQQRRSGLDRQRGGLGQVGDRRAIGRRGAAGAQTLDQQRPMAVALDI